MPCQLLWAKNKNIFNVVCNILNNQPHQSFTWLQTGALMLEMPEAYFSYCWCWFKFKIKRKLWWSTVSCYVRQILVFILSGCHHNGFNWRDGGTSDDIYLIYNILRGLRRYLITLRKLNYGNIPSVSTPSLKYLFKHLIFNLKIFLTTHNTRQLCF